MQNLKQQNTIEKGNLKGFFSLFVRKENIHIPYIITMT